MAQTVERPIVTHPSSPEYDAGWVFTFRKCPVCRAPLNVKAEDDFSIEAECPECPADVNVDLRPADAATCGAYSEYGANDGKGCPQSPGHDGDHGDLDGR
jgi:hypothetical protein